MSPQQCLAGIQTKLKKAGLYSGEVDALWGPLTKSAIMALQDALQAPDDPLGALDPVSGKVSTFGGPDDVGVTPSEGLWCFPEDKIPAGFESLFLSVQPPGTSGLARRLNPDKFYIACRWFGKTSVDVESRRKLRLLRYRVSANGKSVVCQPADWGPAEWTKRIADISPGAADALGVKTDDVVTVELVS